MTPTAVTVLRRVGFGECEAYRTYHAPRAIEFAVEAVEAWYEEMLGVSWADMVCHQGVEVVVATARCEYRATPPAEQLMRMRVQVVKITPFAITFTITGEGEGHHVCFSAAVDTGFLDLTSHSRVPVPDEFSNRVGLLTARGLDQLVSVDFPGMRPEGEGDKGSAPKSEDEIGKGGKALSTRQRLSYGDFTLAGSMHVPKMFTRCVESIAQWYRESLGISWDEQIAGQGGDPLLMMQGELLHRVVPGQEMVLEVTYPRVGEVSTEYRVTAYVEEVPVFAAHMLVSFDKGITLPLQIPGQPDLRLMQYVCSDDVRLGKDVCSTVRAIEPD